MKAKPEFFDYIHTSNIYTIPEPIEEDSYIIGAYAEKTDDRDIRISVRGIFSCIISICSLRFIFTHFYSCLTLKID